MHHHSHRIAAHLALLSICSLIAAGAQAEAAHQHGVVRLDVAVDARTLTVHLEAPLDSLLGFEHRPRNDAQRRAADALLTRMKEVPALLRPDASAQCSLTRTLIESEALSPKAGVKEEAHVDLDATYEFDCQQPEHLAGIEIGLFDAFKRIQRIEVQVASAKGQSKQTLQRPAKLLRLVR